MEYFLSSNQIYLKITAFNLNVPQVTAFTLNIPGVNASMTRGIHCPGGGISHSDTDEPGYYSGRIALLMGGANVFLALTD